MEKHYTVHQAAEMTGVKSYVLRYWEDELSLRIGRNELGHRYYTGYDIQLFLNIRELKNRGLKLSAIKEVMPQIAKNAPGSSNSKVKLIEGDRFLDTEKAEVESLKKELENDTDYEDAMTANEDPKEACAVQEEKILEFQQIMERLINQELQMKNEGERRCRSLDAAIRRQQLARKEAAAASEKKEKRKRKVHR